MLAHNMADCVTGIKQLAKRHPYMDINRVGVVDGSTIPAALTGTLVYPELYKVGVSLNPMIPGLFPPLGGVMGSCDVFPAYEDFAKNLSGKLLLIHGMLEDLIPVSGTFRIVEALKKANKDCDMLLLPNSDHKIPSGYIMRRMWDYLVTHLLEREPPKDFALVRGLETIFPGCLD